MQTKTLRRWNNALHRDLGYLAFGMTIIYAISGIVLNHFKSGDFTHPDYNKSYKDFKVTLPKNGIADQTYVYSVLGDLRLRTITRVSLPVTITSRSSWIKGGFTST
jgi:hypothetical protein